MEQLKVIMDLFCHMLSFCIYAEGEIEGYKNRYN